MMDKTLRGPYGASCGFESGRTEPKRGRTCAQCRKQPPAAGDPFCSARCCRAWYGCGVEKGERYPAAETVGDGVLLCLKCKAWLPDDSFYGHRGRPKRRYRGGWCRECKREENRKRDRADNERARGRRRRAAAAKRAQAPTKTGDPVVAVPRV